MDHGGDAASGLRKDRGGQVHPLRATRGGAGTVLISQDRWLKLLFGDELKEVADYLRIHPKLCAAMGPHVSELLKAGVDVVLDFPANTVAMRAWMKGIAEAAGAPHMLHLLDVPDETCRERLRQRNEAGDHDFAATDAQFEAITALFQPPGPDEGLNLVTRS